MAKHTEVAVHYNWASSFEKTHNLTERFGTRKQALAFARECNRCPFRTVERIVKITVEELALPA